MGEKKMDMEWPSSTNKGTALLKLKHQFDPNRILHDDYINWFFDESTIAKYRNAKPSVNEDPKDPDRKFSRIAYWYAILREKYIDDIIENRIESGCRQLLLLGSGYDTRFFRLPSIRKYSVATFEVDLPETIKEKMTIFKKRLGSLPAGLSLIPLNFNDNDLNGIVRGGFEPALPTVYVWQGVSYYLPEQTVSTVLNFIRTKMATGSLLSFDCCSPLMLIENDEIPGIRFNIERLKQIGEPYIFGMEPKDMKSWLQEKGFQHIDVAMQDDLEMTYLHTRTLPKKMWYVVTATSW
jgi:methyltransferase (TIGR00027 family)